jgi:hypothetical protein
MKPEKIVSAQVVLCAANGARPGPQSRITSENIREWLPSEQIIAHASAAMRSMGFEVGECIANSFSITGTVTLFESSFATKLREIGHSVQFVGDGNELAAEKIPAALRAHVAAITFTPPPDFGPGAASSFM